MGASGREADIGIEVRRALRNKGIHEPWVIEANVLASLINSTNIRDIKRLRDEEVVRFMRHRTALLNAIGEMTATLKALNYQLTL